MSSSSDTYASIRRAQLTCAYLHTNSTTHEFLFGALAELVDNARDASSKKIDIYTEPAESFRGKFMLCFKDDGDGMDQSEVANVIQFGRSIKRKVDQHMIGQYGNGLKSGTMRIGKDMLLFSKKNNTLNCLFLSQTFLKQEKLDDVVVPMPSWDGSTKQPLLREGEKLADHRLEVGIIMKYSPFKTEQDLLDEFDKLNKTGTLVVVYNMQTMDNGEPELDIVSDPHDIKMADPNAGERYCEDDSVLPERKSFRAYSAILYLDPKMKIYIQHKKVHTRRLITCLYKPREYQFTSSRFKRRSEKEADKAEEEYKLAQSNCRDVVAHKNEMEDPANLSKMSMADQRKLNKEVAEAQADVIMKKKTAMMKRKSTKDPKTLKFMFGINLENRKCCGVMVYNCSRLIKLYEKVGCQTEGGIKGYGVIGIVDIPYLVLEPTHNKQDFADHKEFKSLTRALGEHLDHYWSECPIASQGPKKFWETYGYLSEKLQESPSNEPRYLRKRMMDSTIYVQCDKCLKWRSLPFHSSLIGKDLPDDWCCRNHPLNEYKHCHKPEQAVDIPKATLKKVVKTAEEKREALEKELKKNQQKLEELQRRTGAQPSTSMDETSHRAASPQSASAATRVSGNSRQPSPRPRQPQATPAQRQQRVAAPPPKQVAKPTRTPQVQAPPQRAAAQRATRNLNADSNANEASQSQGQKRPLTLPVKQEAQSSSKRKKEDPNMEWSSDSELSVASPAPSPSQHSVPDIVSLQGRLCEGRTENDEWHVATVIQVKQSNNGVTKVKVKYRDHPKDKFDKWYVYPGPEIHLLEKDGPISQTSATIPTSPTSVTSPRSSVASPPSRQASQPASPAVELPSTTTTIGLACTAAAVTNFDMTSPVRSPDTNVSSFAEREEILQQLGRSLRDCLVFFIPPDYSVSREQIHSLSLEELRDFPMADFKSNYERHLKELVTDLQKRAEEAEGRVAELERQKAEVEQQLAQTSDARTEACRKLSGLRRSARQLIVALHSGDVLPDSDDVDVVLANIAQEAEEQQHVLNG
ncbi:ATPase MORC2A isoform X2 [Nematostella vectensis]|uniref:ATPase MORC2A isoform X2 n=1 Tax=Nematostella vectensis TaxID=45351 RepID=UPI0020771733|nr:ATPase MORC2A isoform X2 [Nematostella vectensis]